jgi:hypothetical protein
MILLFMRGSLVEVAIQYMEAIETDITSVLQVAEPSLYVELRLLLDTY